MRPDEMYEDETDCLARRDAGMLQLKVCLLKRAYVSAKNSSVEVDVTLADFVRATLCEGVVESSLVAKNHIVQLSACSQCGEKVLMQVSSTP